ncbi:GlxA family transcriptional regulator [uncultured Pseudokineococcus sp.]|uniref:GlxA family transcriptional regulator n=1 Tax=uncultured Pseudokineococcus sp. TaxID=1642928 RepID=UPI00262AC092|nr:DJ-1/PfpI family protein [uncultured Pseudokineococcus sp.]
MVSTVLFVVPDQVHLLDLAGPAQVFSTAHDEGSAGRLAYVGATPAVASHQGVPLQVDTHWPALGRDALVVVPGRRVGAGAPAAGLPPQLLERVAAHAAAGGRVVGICTGAFALAEAGVLDGRRATTHHDVQDVLTARYPRVRVVRDVLFVVDGAVATSAGVASGVDLALHLLAVDHGPALAARVARAMVVPLRRDGSGPQVSAMLRHRDHLADVVHRALDVVDARFTTPLPLSELAAAVGVSERTLTRVFAATTGTTPLRYQQELRLERAEHLIGQGATLEAAARDVGFGDARMLRRLRRRDGSRMPGPPMEGGRSPGGPTGDRLRDGRAPSLTTSPGAG